MTIFKHAFFKLSARQRARNPARAIWNAIQRFAHARTAKLYAHKVRSHVSTNFGAHPLQIAIDRWLTQYRDAAALAIKNPEENITENPAAESALRDYHSSMQLDDEDWIAIINNRYISGNIHKAIRTQLIRNAISAAPPNARIAYDITNNDLHQQLAKTWPAHLKPFLIKTTYNCLPTMQQIHKYNLTNSITKQDNGGNLTCTCGEPADTVTQLHILNCHDTCTGNHQYTAAMLASIIAASPGYISLYPDRLWTSSSAINDTTRKISVPDRFTFTRTSAHEKSPITVIKCILTPTHSQPITAYIRESKFWSLHAYWKSQNPHSSNTEFGSTLYATLKDLKTLNTKQGTDDPNKRTTPTPLLEALRTHCHLTTEAYCNSFNAHLLFEHHYSLHPADTLWGFLFNAHLQDWIGKFIYANPPYITKVIETLIQKAANAIQQTDSFTRIIAILPAGDAWTVTLKKAYDSGATLLCEFDKNTVKFQPDSAFVDLEETSDLYTGGKAALADTPIDQEIRIIVWQTPQTAKQYPIPATFKEDVMHWLGSHIKLTKDEIDKFIDDKTLKHMQWNEKTIEGPESITNCMCCNDQWQASELITTKPKLMYKDARKKLIAKRITWGTMVTAKTDPPPGPPPKHWNPLPQMFWPLLAFPLIGIPSNLHTPSPLTNALRDFATSIQWPAKHNNQSFRPGIITTNEWDTLFPKSQEINTGTDEFQLTPTTTPPKSYRSLQLALKSMQHWHACWKVHNELIHEQTQNPTQQSSYTTKQDATANKRRLPQHDSETDSELNSETPSNSDSDRNDPRAQRTSTLSPRKRRPIESDFPYRETTNNKLTDVLQQQPPPLTPKMKQQTLPPHLIPKQRKSTTTPTLRIGARLETQLPNTNPNYQQEIYLRQTTLAHQLTAARPLTPQLTQRLPAALDEIASCVKTQATPHYDTARNAIDDSTKTTYAYK